MNDQCLSCILYNGLALFQCLTVVCMPRNEMEWFDRVFLDHRDSMMMMVMMWQRAKSSMLKTVSLTQGNPTYWKCWEFSCTEMLCSLWCSLYPFIAWLGESDWFLSHYLVNTLICQQEREAWKYCHVYVFPFAFQ